MSSNDINEEWKDILTNINDDYSHHNIYKFLESIKGVIDNNYKNEKDYSKKHKLIKNSWYCDTLKEYIYFLEKNLSKSIKTIKKLEEGFDERNNLYGLSQKKK